MSTREQNEARQLAAIREFGVVEENIITEKLFGKDFNRPLYQNHVAKLLPDDVLVVKSIDRARRNYEEILEQWAYTTKERRRPSWCWICPCWIPGGGETSWHEPLYIYQVCQTQGG